MAIFFSFFDWARLRWLVFPDAVSVSCPSRFRNQCTVTRRSFSASVGIWGCHVGTCVLEVEKHPGPGVYADLQSSWQLQFVTVVFTVLCLSARCTGRLWVNSSFERENSSAVWSGLIKISAVLQLSATLFTMGITQNYMHHCLWIKMRCFNLIMFQTMSEQW